MQKKSNTPEDGTNPNYITINRRNSGGELEGFIKIGGPSSFDGQSYLISIERIAYVEILQNLLRIFFIDETYLDILFISNYRNNEIISLFFGYLKAFLPEEKYNEVKILSTFNGGVCDF